MSANETYNENEGAGQAFAIIVGAIALIALLWSMPRCGRIDIAPDNNSVNINGAQRDAVEEVSK